MVIQYISSFKSTTARESTPIRGSQRATTANASITSLYRFFTYKNPKKTNSSPRKASATMIYMNTM